MAKQRYTKRRKAYHRWLKGKVTYKKCLRCGIEKTVADEKAAVSCKGKAA